MTAVGEYCGSKRHLRANAERLRADALVGRLRGDGWIAWRVGRRTLIALREGCAPRFVAVTGDGDHPLAGFSPQSARFHARLARQAGAIGEVFWWPSDVDDPVPIAVTDWLPEAAGGKG